MNAAIPPSARSRRVRRRKYQYARFSRYGIDGRLCASLPKGWIAQHQPKLPIKPTRRRDSPLLKRGAQHSQLGPRPLAAALPPAGCTPAPSSSALQSLVSGCVEQPPNARRRLQREHIPRRNAEEGAGCAAETNSQLRRHLGRCVILMDQRLVVGHERWRQIRLRRFERKTAQPVYRRIEAASPAWAATTGWQSPQSSRSSAHPGLVGGSRSKSSASANGPTARFGSGGGRWLCDPSPARPRPAQSRTRNSSLRSASPSPTRPRCVCWTSSSSR